MNLPAHLGRGRLALGAALLALALICGAAAALRPVETMALVKVLRTAATDGWFGIVLFSLTQTLIALSGALPASLLGVAAGAVFGAKVGFVLAGAGTLLGAQLSYYASRSLLRGFAARAIVSRPRIRELDAMIARDGLRFVCLLRMSPIMPFAMTSYALGMTSIGARDYALGTLAALPALFGYVLIGALAGDGADAWSSAAGGFRVALFALAALATLVLTLKLASMARRIASMP